jgi:hypothetical protein
MSVPTGLNFGKQMGSLLVGHNLLIPGRPNVWTPLLARHFSLIEQAMRTPADALYFSHTISVFFSYPNRTDLVAACSQDSQSRLKAQIFWGKYLASTKEYGDYVAIAMRGALLLIHLATLFPWFVVASCFPGMVHQVLATGADITWKKYETTITNTENYQLYQNHISEMQRLATIHTNAANSTFVCPFTCVLALIWFFFWRASQSAQAPRSNIGGGGYGGFGGGGGNQGNFYQNAQNAHNPGIGPSFTANFPGMGQQQ